MAINEIKGQITDAIEALKLDLELEGRGEIGNVYAAGEVYELFPDLKKIIGGASEEILLVDPYFNGEAFERLPLAHRVGKNDQDPCRAICQ